MTPRIFAMAQLLFMQVMGIGCWTAPFYGDDTLPKAEVPIKAVHNSIGMEFVLIPAGEFEMGSDESVDEMLKLYGKERNVTLNSSIKGIKHSKPSHHVIITKPFYFGKYEVTVGEFKQFVESTGYVPEAGKFGGGWGFEKARGHVDQAERFTWENPGYEQTDTHPVGTVSWNDAVAFCQWLGRVEQKEYRLPTEAEWEYACRAGSTTRYSFGDDPEGLAQFGNVADGTKSFHHGVLDNAINAEDGFVFTAPVGSFRPNAWGLYDMHGNVSEWCSDWISSRENYYATSAIEDPQGMAAPPTSWTWENRVKVNRGGSWDDGAWSCLSASRSGQAIAGATSCGCVLGFRVVVSTDPTLPLEGKADP